ncbi:MAG: threonine ammonia-lyase [Betaproteobacteria bacterium]|nr:threonine ammonia-lyase [Betaproteobacteria bacterium]
MRWRSSSSASTRRRASTCSLWAASRSDCSLAVPGDGAAGDLSTPAYYRGAAAYTSGVVSLEDIRAAAGRIAGAVERTPFVPSRTLSELTGARVFLKFENLQFTASFKERGALNKLLSLTPEERRRGVIAMSAGNHAQAVAYHSARLGIPATIVMPRGSPNTKVKNTRVHGARVLLEGDSLHEAGAHARELAARERLVFVHPYEDPLIIAGQGTVGLEMLEDVPDLEALVVPVGGGGLLSGMAIAASALRKGIEIYGAESATYPSMHQRLAGKPVEVGGDTIAEGIAVKDVGDIAFGIIGNLAREVFVVQEETIEGAIVALIEVEKTVAEGAGAAALAALLENPARFAGKRVGVPISGGNIDSRVLASVLMRGLVRDARLVRLRVTMPDVSGSLAKTAALIAEAGGNIVEVQHQRIFGTASVKSPEVEFLVETRDREHTEALVALLRAHGINVSGA